MKTAHIFVKHLMKFAPLLLLATSLTACVTPTKQNPNASRLVRHTTKTDDGFMWLTFTNVNYSWEGQVNRNGNLNGRGTLNTWDVNNGQLTAQSRVVFNDGVPQNPIEMNITRGNAKGVKWLFAFNAEGFLTSMASYYPGGKQRSSASLDSKGLKHGPDKKYYDSGVLLSVAYYHRGIAHGPHLTYYPDGSPMDVDNKKNGKLDGYCVRHYRNGEKKEEIYHDGVISHRKYKGRWHQTNAIGQVIVQSPSSQRSSNEADELADVLLQLADAYVDNDRAESISPTILLHRQEAPQAAPQTPLRWAVSGGISRYAATKDGKGLRPTFASQQVWKSYGDHPNAQYRTQEEAQAAAQSEFTRNNRYAASEFRKRYGRDDTSGGGIDTISLSPLY